MNKDSISTEELNNPLFPHRKRDELFKRLVVETKKQVSDIFTPDNGEITILGEKFESKHIPITFWVYKKHEDIMKLLIDQLIEELGFDNFKEGVISVVRNLESDFVHFV